MADESIQEHCVKSIIDASFSRAYDGVYFLGPYAHRVSFSAQQNRALNLVWALKCNKKIRSGINVAVVGGGLTGLTTCAALVELGCEVYLFESGRRILNRQISTMHRYIHPTINNWPCITVSHTTCLPYYDWASGRCGELMNLLRAEWTERKKTCEDRLKYVKRCEVKSFLSSNDSVAIITEGENPYSHVRYDVVIVTSGFSEELNTGKAGFFTYWENDNLEKRIDGNGISKFIVSGCGDGGVIEALRISHKDYNYGELVVKVAELLEKNKWCLIDEIKKIEKDFYTNNQLCSEKHCQFYTKAAKNLPREVLAILEGGDGNSRSIRSDEPGLVTLLTKERHPYLPTAAPIHKLLLAHAIQNHVIEHKCGELQEYNENYVEYKPHSAGSSSIKLYGHVIVRHGAEPSFKAFFKDSIVECDELINKQKVLAQDFDKPFWRKSVDPLKNWPPSEPPFDEDELQRRMKHLRPIIYNKSNSYPHFYASSETGFHIRFGPNDKLIDKLPDTLFGFPLIKNKLDESQHEDSNPYCGAKKTHSDADLSIEQGMDISAFFTGKLGPLVIDENDQLLAVVADHVVQGKNGVYTTKITDSKGRVLGTMDSACNRKVKNYDLVTIRINEHLKGKINFDKNWTVGGLANLSCICGITVKKRNSDGSYSIGVVVDINVPIKFIHPGREEKLFIQNAISIKSCDGSKCFSEEGDSGSPVLTEDNKLVGIVVSGNKKYTYVIPVQEYLHDRKLELVTNNQTQFIQGIPDKSTIYTHVAINETIANFAKFNRKSLCEKSLDLGDMPNTYYKRDMGEWNA